MSKSRVPPRHLALSHGALRDRLASVAKLSYARRDEVERRAWDPLTHSHSSFVDLGRGLLDSFALALHVLWTYQQAWAEEGFLATARLDSSVGKLLGHIGYQPRPGTAAVGLQHFRCKVGISASLPAGTAVVSKAKGKEEAQVIYETLSSLRIVPELNEMRAFLPAGAGEDAGRGGRLGDGGGERGEPGNVPPANGLFGDGSILDALRDRLEVARHGPLEDRRVARARQEARKLAGLVNQLAESGAACKDSLDSLCKKLCDAQKIVAQAQPPPGRPVGGLSEAQEMLARLLRNLAKRHGEAVEALECALEPCEGESAEDYAHRLDCFIKFLDILIGLLIQEARDNVVLLRGTDALNRLDRALGSGSGTAGTLGRAHPGGDFLYFLPINGKAPPLRPGDWLVVAEDLPGTGPDGRPSTVRSYREAVRVIRVRMEKPRGRRQALLHVTFQPPLRRAYNLDNVVILGNNTMVSHGATVIELGQPSPDRRTIPLKQAPLTWLRDPQRPGGRRAEAWLTVGDRAWKQVDTLLDAGPDDAVFAVESVPGGGSRLRVGDGVNGAVLPLQAPVALRYRIGLGHDGNRAGERADEPATPHPAIDKTFNPLDFTGGADAEAAGLARTVGPATVGAGDRAVSARDVQALAEVVDGVRRARVFRDLVRRRTLVVVVCGPDGGALTESDLRALQAHLLARVPPGVHIKTENRIPVPVEMEVLLRVEPTADPVLVVRQARLRLGVDREPDAPFGLLDPERVDLGDDLQLSHVYDALHGIPGLRSAVVKSLHRADDRAGRSDRVVTSPREVLIWGSLDTAGKDGVKLDYEEARDL